MISGISSHWHYVWLVVASFIAGVMNAMAGGGSFLSFPAMLAMGVPPVQANATNTVALWPGQLTSLAALRSDVRMDLLPVVAVTSVLGGLCGAVVLLRTHAGYVSAFDSVVAADGFRDLRDQRAGVAVAAGAVRDTACGAQAEIRSAVLRAVSDLLLHWILWRGGGFLIMTVLALFGVEEMHALNAMKVVAACLSNLVAIAAFIVTGAVLWHYCLISMVFAGAGGYVGAQYARRMNPEVLRAIVVVTGCVISAYFFWRQH